MQPSLPIRTEKFPFSPVPWVSVSQPFFLLSIAFECENISSISDSHEIVKIENFALKRLHVDCATFSSQHIKQRVVEFLAQAVSEVDFSLDLHPCQNPTDSFCVEKPIQLLQGTCEI